MNNKKFINLIFKKIANHENDSAKALLNIFKNKSFCDEEGRTPLIVAAIFANHNMLSWLISKKVPVDKRDKTGRTAIMYSAGIGDIESFNTLFLAGADTKLIDNDNKTTMSHWNMHKELFPEFLNEVLA